MARPRTYKALGVERADKAKRAAELVLQGLTYEEAAHELGFKSKSSITQLFDDYRQEMPREAVERLQKVQLARLRRAQDAAMHLLDDEDPNVRLKAAVAVARVSDTIGRIGKIVDLPVPVVNVAVMQTEQFDLSKLAIEDVSRLREIRMKLLGPGPQVVEAQGHEVHTEPKERDHDNDDRGLEDQRESRLANCP